MTPYPMGPDGSTGSEDVKEGKKRSKRKISGFSRKITPQQAKLVKARVMDPKATLRELGEKLDYSGAPAVWKALNKPEVRAAVISERERLRDLMDARADLGRERLLDHLASGLEADKQISAAGDVGPDHQTRHRFLSTALELRGALGHDVAGQIQGPLTIGIIMNGGGTDQERSAVVDIIKAARISRGLHPLENRDLTDQDRKDLGL